MDAVKERLADRLILRAASIDELLSGAFEPALGPKPDAAAEADLPMRRLAAWRRASAAGDDALFTRRLERDRLSLAAIEERLTLVRHRAAATMPPWLDDAVWIETALLEPAPAGPVDAGEPYAFEDVFATLIAQADARLWSGLGAAATAWFDTSARADLRRALAARLSELCAAPLYERFSKTRAAGYAGFVADLQAGGFRRLFEDKPVLLRLIATVVRQWIDTSREFVARLAADLPAIRRELPDAAPADRCVTAIEGDLSDPHNGGRAVLIVNFAGGGKVAYKPKDLRLDVAWHDLIDKLNGDAPLALRAPRALARAGYGWSEFIAHTGCADAEACARYFRRAGAWLALLHCFAATDMHQENVIAAGAHPVPIDLETILQPSADEHKGGEPESAAFDAALEIVGNSALTVGLLPAYGRSVDNQVFAMGGLTADWNLRNVITWNDVNSDAMRPARATEHSSVTPNLPHVGGVYAKFDDHIESFIAGFADYAAFLQRLCRTTPAEALLAPFAGLPVRRVIRPTRFYYMLLQRLKDHRSMDDGAVWSAQADFVARLSDWDKDDLLWPLHRAERAALLSLNVPHFTAPSDGGTISDATGIGVATAASSGLDRAKARLRRLDENEIAWQVEVIRENTRPAAVAPRTVAPPAPTAPQAPSEVAPSRQAFIAEAGDIAGDLSRHAIRRGPGAAWIGLDWLGDAEVFQLVCLGPDLYNGASGIALFLAAHAAVTGSRDSAELARAGLSHLRKTLKSRTAPRFARSLGIGVATGLGSVTYALTVMAGMLRADDLRADALAAARLFTDDLIAADKQLDVMGGAAGAILALLRLYRDCGAAEVLARAQACGEHLLRQDRLGSEGRRSWIGQGLGKHALTGMSHGAAGFAYALATLAATTGRDAFAEAAAECLAFENARYDAERHNWPDLRASQTAWPCQWCHGAPGIGLARAAMWKRAAKIVDAPSLAADIDHAVAGVARGTPMPVDTLCCGTLGTIEFFCEAATALDRQDLREVAALRLAAVIDRARSAGDYRWNSGKRQFNLGLFRGLAGVGYTLLRQVDPALPNVLIWE